MSNAAASYVSRYDRIDDDGDGDDQPFWLYDPEGDPVIIPPACVGFQVRFWSPNQRGLGTVVVDVRNGRPLILPRSTSPDEFAARVGYKVGRYRLFLLDGAHRRIECAPGQLEITPEMAAARGVVEAGPAPASAPASAVAPSAETFALLLGFLERVNAQAFDAQRATLEQLGGIVGPVSGVLQAAGAAGVVKKTLTLDAAAAGAPVTVQMMPANANDAAPTTAPRNAAGATAAATAAAEKGSGVGEAVMALGLPIVEKVGAAAAYVLAKKADMPEEYARSIAGMVQSSAQIAGKMLRSEDASAVPSSPSSPTVGVAARVGAELLAHVGQIQAGLSADDRAWVFGMMRRPGMIDALKPSVAALTVDEGIAAVRNLRALDGALSTDDERRLFDLLLEPDQLPKVFRKLFVDASAEHTIAHVRQHAATIAEIAAAKTAAADATG